MNDPRPLSLVKFVPYEGFEDQYPLDMREGEFVYMGEIPNMPGHCVVINADTNEMKVGYHTDNFVELTEDEV